jgi:hypothetical protein
MADQISPNKYDFHATLQHGTDFLSEGFFRPKNPTASAGIERANLGTRGQHAKH